MTHATHAPPKGAHLEGYGPSGYLIATTFDGDDTAAAT